MSWRRPWEWLDRGRYVFCFHDVSPDGARHHSPRYSTTPARFASQLAYLAARFRILPLDDLLAGGGHTGRASAAITFDDGFRSVLTDALPVLEHHRMPYTVFVNGDAVLHDRNWVTDLVLHSGSTAFVRETVMATECDPAMATDAIALIMASGRFGKRWAMRPHLQGAERVFLNSDELLALHRRGVPIEDHGWSHTVLSRSDEATLTEEITATRVLIQDITGRLPRHFAIPFGKKEHYDEAIVERIQRLRGTTAHSSNPDRIRRFGPGMLVPRIIVQNETVPQLAFLINRTLVRRIDL